VSRVFIGWDNIDIASVVKEELSSQYRQDVYTVGAVARNEPHFGALAMRQISESDRAIFIISHCNFQPNVFLELGYAYARIPTENIFIATVDIPYQNMPTDILGYRIDCPVDTSTYSTSLLKAERVKRIANCIADAYKKVLPDFSNINPSNIFLAWPKYCSDLVGGNLSTDKMNSVALHSIQSSLYYGEINCLEKICERLSESVRHVISLALRHENKIPFDSDYDSCWYTGTDPWIKIIENDYVGLRTARYAYMLHGQSSNSVVCDAFGVAIEHYRTAIAELDKLWDIDKPDYYIALWYGYLHHNLARVLALQLGNYVAVAEAFRDSICWRTQALNLPNSNHMQICLRLEISLAKLRYCDYRRKSGIDCQNELEQVIQEAECRIRDLSVNNMVRSRVEAEIETLR
jgi:hypothetical protein